MEVHGSASEPIIEFSSNPPLSSEEIVLMLTAGSLPRREVGFSNQQKAGRLAVFLGKGLWSKISPDDGDEERLIIESGEDISSQGKQTYRIEYKLTDDWSLVGEYDRYNALNAGVKWKIFSR
jgi:translocation and assembly module TamB